MDKRTFQVESTVYSVRDIRPQSNLTDKPTMPAPRKHPHAEEIHRLIEQLARWGGNGRAYHRTSPLAWINDYIRRGSGYYSPYIPIMSGEAADTATALQRMDRLLRQVLEVHCLYPGTVDEQLEYVNKLRRSDMKRRTYELQVEGAHDTFWTLFLVVRQQAKQAAKGNAASVPSVGSKPGIAAPRERPQSSDWCDIEPEAKSAKILD